MSNITRYEEVNKDKSSEKAVELFVERAASVIKLKNSCRVVVPTGGSPKRFYEILTADYADSLDWSKMVWITLDELFDIDLNHQATFYSYLKKYLFEPLNIADSAIEALNPQADELSLEEERFAPLCLNADIAVLGVGVDGHIGMNFPPCDPDSTVHILTLPEHGLPSADLFSDGTSRPFEGITMGMKDILSAEWILLLADGKNKAEAMNEFDRGEVTDQWPVTYLHTHEDVTICISEDVLN